MLETLIALMVLAVGVLGLAAMLADALSYMAASQDDFIAQQKAEEAVESIFTAKYNGNITWAQVANYSSASSPQGLFLTGPQPLLQPGPDGLVGSVNDTAATPDYIIYPGADGKLGTADDVDAPLQQFHAHHHHLRDYRGAKLAHRPGGDQLHHRKIHTQLHAEHGHFRLLAR